MTSPTKKQNLKLSNFFKCNLNSLPHLLIIWTVNTSLRQSAGEFMVLQRDGFEVAHAGLEVNSLAPKVLKRHHGKCEVIFTRVIQ